MYLDVLCLQSETLTLNENNYLKTDVMHSTTFVFVEEILYGAFVSKWVQ